MYQVPGCAWMEDMGVLMDNIINGLFICERKSQIIGKSTTGNCSRILLYFMIKYKHPDCEIPHPES